MDNGMLLDWLNSTGISSILPLSPVQTWMHSNPTIFNDIKGFMGMLNWFVPVGWIMSVLSAWLVCIGIFYGVQWLLRTLNVVGS